uniref:G-protein-signaling modulator 2 n=1 Tax=Cacopsylla melanoneura TaxID=428564 RepID=A0A8D8TVR5_9HEMI
MSVGNISSSDSQSGGADGGNMCLELALEGERLCKAGDCRAGVAFFQAAIQAGTDDLRTLSAIYSQLGNAYFYLGDYQKAMQYHKQDLTLARNMEDKLGEAKSSGNLGNTLKVMGKYDEAMVCCKRHLEISRQLNDKLSEGRALYNLGNVYHAKGKAIGKVGQQDPGEYPEEVKVCLQEAIKYYEQNLALMKEINDTAAQGRACGNLGNTYYLLGNFKQAIHYHQERLKIAREFGDKAAERRANSNLGNSHIFLGEYQTASEHYKRTLVLAQDLGDRAVEAQACYSLGNTYTLLRDYTTAIDYHLRHLIIAQQLMDRVGEGRACWSLGNAHAAMGNHEKALYFATKHLEISKQLGDPLGQVTAQMNVTDLRKALGMAASDLSPDSLQLINSYNASSNQASPGVRRYNRLTPENKGKQSGSSNSELSKCDEEESFFELLSRFQSERMEDQRCSLSGRNNSSNKENVQRFPSQGKKTPRAPTMPAHTPGDDDLLDMIVGLQSKRMDEQRAALPHLADRDNAIPDDGFLDMLIRCQGARLEDQRSQLPQEGSTVPDEDFFSLITRLQSGRMEDQRATVPVLRKT